MRAVICPVCGGTGKLPYQLDNSTEPSRSCHGCSGRGWILIEEWPQDQPWLPFYPYLPRPWLTYQPDRSGWNETSLININSRLIDG